ncbi:MAG TPA: NosD domain-containing protein, partial [Roseiflexaceae bacterium]|nr:NosD domain-containing protein [Roseiflexaceae bacterium]
AYYTDLTSSPAGAYVTVWGKGFGSSAGSVMVGGATASGADIVSWSDSMIEFRVPTGAGSGITVVAASGSSNALPFTTRASGRIFYVSKATGSNSNNGLAPTPGSAGVGPWRDLTQVAAKLAPGDIVYVRAGTYNELDNSTYGTSLLAKNKFAKGTVSAPIAVVAYPREKPVVGAPANRRAIMLEGGQAYWTIAKLTLQAASAALELGANGANSGMRWVGNEASNVPSPYGTFILKACSDCQVLGNHVYNSGQPGSKLAHLIYYGGYGVGRNVEIAWNRLHDEKGGRCLQVYGHTDADRLSGLSIHDNIVYNCPYDGILVGKSDASYKNWISDALIYNNVVWGARNAAIRLDNPGVKARLFHNTLHANSQGLRIQTAASAEARNNIFSQTSAPVRIESVGTLTLSNNGYQGGTPPAQDKPAFTGDPQYVNPAAGDFTLQATSPFKGKGALLNLTLPGLFTTATSAPDLGSLMRMP